jgi:hypothetical protein
VSYELYAFKVGDGEVRYCISEDGYLLRYWFGVAPLDTYYTHRWKRCSAMRISVEHSCYPRAELVYECETKKEMEEYIEGLMLIEELKR